MHTDAVDSVLRHQEGRGDGPVRPVGFGGGGDGDTAVQTARRRVHHQGPDEEWDDKHKLAWNARCWACTCRGIRSTAWRILRKHAKRPIAAILADPPKEGEIEIAGLITSLERRVNKKGEPWAICTVEDMDASLEVLFFPKSYALFAADLVEDNAVVVKGRVNWRDDKMSVFAAGLVPLDLSDVALGDEEPPLTLLASAEKITKSVVIELKQTLQAHRGDTPVRLKLVGKSSETLYALYDYPVTVSSMLLGELKSIPGIAAASG